MTLLALSLVALAAAPLLVPLLQRARWAARALDAFILVSICGLVFVHILPHSLARAGWPAVAALVIGLLLPFAVESLGDPDRGAGHKLAAAVGLAALAVHALLDGVALAAPGQGAEAGTLLATAVLLHRLPMGMAIWWLVRPRYGTRGALLALGVIVVTSVAGFAGSSAVPELFEGRGWLLLQSLLLGALMHVVAHQSTGPAALDPHARWQPASAAGGLIAVGTLVAVSLVGPHAHHGVDGARGAFASLALASAPPLLAAFVVASLINALRPRRIEEWLRGGGTPGQALRGTLLGLPLNICSCAVAPTYRRMTARGMPPAAAVAFLVAAPEVGIASVLLTLRLLGVGLGIVRPAVALLLGLAVGAWIGKIIEGRAGRQMHLPGMTPEPASGLAGRVREGISAGLVEQANHTLPWLVVGLGTAALLTAVIEPGDLDAIPAFAQVPLMAVLGTPLYVCATGSTPIVAVLVYNGLSPGAAIAFLITGQVTNRSTWSMLSRLHGRKVALTYALGVSWISMILGWIVNMALEPSPDAPGLSPAGGALGILERTSLAVLVLVTLVSLVRQGVPGFVEQVLSLHGHRHEHREHEHPDRHGHGPTTGR
jgi:hypothetical protein